MSDSKLLVETEIREREIQGNPARFEMPSHRVPLTQDALRRFRKCVSIAPKHGRRLKPVFQVRHAPECSIPSHCGFVG